MTNGTVFSETKPSALIDGETSGRITSLRYILSVLVVSGGRKQNSCFCAERGRRMDSVCDFIRVWKLRRSAFFHVQRVPVF